MDENILDLAENYVDRFDKLFWTTIISYRFSKAFWPDCLWTDLANPCGLTVYEQIEQTLMSWFFMNRFSNSLSAGLIVYEQIELALVDWLFMNRFDQTLVGWLFMNRLSKPFWAGLIVYEQIEQTLVAWLFVNPYWKKENEKHWKKQDFQFKIILHLF